MNPAHATGRTLRPLMTIIAILLLMASGGGAFAASIKFCFTFNGDFIDNDYPLPGGTTEDLWVADQRRHLRGAKTIVKIGATTYFDGTLGAGGPIPR